ncbi:MAG: hypothetical protein IPJ81_01035 [Chitinophagaceae bacterium]|nr:hypothetical protein [Chitinophagaceae bacterium]
MKRIIGVECWADYYFFSKLLLDEKLIRKEKNKQEVVKGIIERSKGGFSIGIVDHDNEDLISYIKKKYKVGSKNECEIENSVLICDEINIVKIKNHPYFIIQLLPNEFENWIIRFLENNCNKSLTEFGYTNFEEFKNDSKVIYERLINNEKFITLIRFVLKSQADSENYINKLKIILEYLIEKNYSVDINKLKNIWAIKN